MTQLTKSVKEVVTLDPNLSARMAAFDIQSDNRSDTDSIHSVATSATVTSPRESVSFSFERALAKSRVYQIAMGNTSTRSFQTVITSKSKWSQLSGLSLSEVSNVAAI
jgi:hypothetical protein